jgi:hypothetical protein
MPPDLLPWLQQHDQATLRDLKDFRIGLNRSKEPQTTFAYAHLLALIRYVDTTVGPSDLYFNDFHDLRIDLRERFSRYFNWNTQSWHFGNEHRHELLAAYLLETGAFDGLKEAHNISGNVLDAVTCLLESLYPQNIPNILPR